MKLCILMASPRLKGNTVELLKPFIAELEDNGAEATYIALSDKNILPCKGCYACQNVRDSYGCIQTGIKRLCEHSKLKYMGMYSVRDEDDLASFQTDEAVNGARNFAKKLLSCENLGV